MTCPSAGIAAMIIIVKWCEVGGRRCGAKQNILLLGAGGGRWEPLSAVFCLIHN